MTYNDYWSAVQGYRIYSRATGLRVERDLFYRAHLNNMKRVEQLIAGTNPVYQLVRHKPTKP